MNTLIIIMFIAIVMIGLGLLVVISLTRRGGSVLNQDKYRSEWMKIMSSVTSDAHSWQFAVLSADKLLDQAMRERGIAGETMGDRLKNATSQLSGIDRVWTVHKLRNRIAHESNVAVSRRQTGEALKVFKRALADLGAL